jgi:hypothetical protein
MFDVPTYLYHRTTVKAYTQIMADGKIRHSGTPASHWRFKCLKFDEFGRENEDWGVFLAKNANITRGLVWEGDIVLTIRTSKLKKRKLIYDNHVSRREYGKSFIYKDDIPVSEIVKVIDDPYKR